MKYTAAELRAMAKRGEIKTNWKEAAKKPLPSGRDVDNAVGEINWMTAELPKPQRKDHMTLRIDADVTWARRFAPLPTLRSPLDRGPNFASHQS